MAMTPPVGLLARCAACEAHTADAWAAGWIPVGREGAWLCSWDCVRRFAARRMLAAADVAVRTA